MVRAIREFLQRTGVKVGFKPAGGIRTAKDSLAWLSLMKEELGNDYVKVNKFSTTNNFNILVLYESYNMIDWN